MPLRALLALLIAGAAVAQVTPGGPSVDWVFERKAYPSTAGLSVQAMRTELKRAEQRHGPSTFFHLVHYRDRELETSVLMHGYVDLWTARVARKTYGATDLFITEGVSVRSGAAVRVRDGQAIRKTVIRGADPFLLGAGAEADEVVYLGHASAKPFVFVRTKRPITVESAYEIDRLAELQFGGETTVHIRNDSCFAGVITLPPVNPFAKWECEGTPRPSSGFCGTSRKRGGRFCEVEQFANPK